MPTNVARNVNKPSSRVAGRRHHGWLTMELGVAAALLVLMTMTFSRMAYSIQDARESLHLRQVALECMQQAVDEVFAVESEALTHGGLAAMQLPAWAAAQLPGGTLQAAIRPELSTLDGEIGVQVLIRWNGPSPQAVTTTLYRYPSSLRTEDEEASP